MDSTSPVDPLFDRGDPIPANLNLASEIQPLFAIKSKMVLHAFAQWSVLSCGLNAAGAEK